MKDILIVAHFTLFPWESGNGRFNYLAEMLCESGFAVEMATSNFYHSDKAQRNCTEEQLQSVPYKVTLLQEPGYPKNVCLKRLSSHKSFAKNLKKYLAQRNKPDLVYCSVPSLDAACVAAEYCEKNSVPFIVDIQDLWPEAFKMVFHVPIVSNVIFSPMNRKANKAYKAADKIIAVSETYAERGMRHNKKCDKAEVIYLGTDKDYFDKCASKCYDEMNWISGDVARLAKAVSENNEKKVRLTYVGTLGSSYDLELIFESLRRVDKTVLDNMEFIVMGDGPKRRQFEEAAQGLPVVFTGALPYEQMVWLLTRCDIAVNPIVKGSAGSIINKHMDYAMSGLPVINTQECIEYRNLVEKYACGINCECGNADDVVKAIEELAPNGELRKTMGCGSRKMGEEMFDRKTTYKRIADVIYEIGGVNR